MTDYNKVAEVIASAKEKAEYDSNEEARLAVEEIKTAGRTFKVENGSVTYTPDAE